MIPPLCDCLFLVLPALSELECSDCIFESIYTISSKNVTEQAMIRCATSYKRSSMSFHVGLVLLIYLEMLVFLEGGIKSEHYMQRFNQRVG